MSTLARRWTRTLVGPVGIDRRGLVIVSSLCAALFVLFFLIGRERTTGSAAKEQVPSALTAASVAAVPAQLSSAPPIAIVVAAPQPRAHAAPASPPPTPVSTQTEPCAHP
ncbi:MAG: hypothetical protein ABSG95_03060 [Solirubrobacteraceae bacterium]